MKMQSLKTVTWVCLCLAIVVSCTSDNDPEIKDDRSFVVNDKTDFFINHDGSVNLKLTASYVNDHQFGNVSKIGFVYGLTTEPKVDGENTVEAGGAPDNSFATLKNLEHGKSYFVRGYLAYDDGTYYYGDEIQLSTDIDASVLRSLKLTMEPTHYWRSQTEITAQLNFVEVIKEMPMEIGFEYSLSNNFSNSTIVVNDNYSGAHNDGVIVVTAYQSIVSGLSSSTQYCFRPYAKYNDGIVSNGGTSVVTLSTAE